MFGLMYTNLCLILANMQLKPVHCFKYRSADKSLDRPGRKQAWNCVRDAHDVTKIETRVVLKFLFLQGKAPKEIQAILIEMLACFLPGRAKDLSASRVGLVRRKLTPL